MNTATGSPLPHPERAQARGDRVHLALQLGVGELVHLAVLGSRITIASTVAAAAERVAVDAVVGEVHPAADEPLGPGSPAEPSSTRS